MQNDCRFKEQSFEWSIVAHTRIESHLISGKFDAYQIGHEKDHFLYLDERLKIHIFPRRVCDLRPSFRTHYKRKQWSKTSSRKNLQTAARPYLFFLSTNDCRYIN